MFVEGKLYLLGCGQHISHAPRRSLVGLSDLLLHGWCIVHGWLRTERDIGDKDLLSLIV